jgi:K+-sensing histidine kinase KdpD
VQLITSFNNEAEKIKSNEKCSSDVSDFQKQTNRQLDCLIDILDDFLDITKYDNGSLLVHPKRFDLTTLMKNVIDDKLLCFNENLQIILKIDEIIAHNLEGDAQKLARALHILLDEIISNSISETTIKIDVTKSAHSSKSMILHFKIDYTEEIKNPMLINSFKEVERYWHVNNNGGRSIKQMQSTLLYRFVELMGGTCWVDFQKNNGFIFNMTIVAQKVDSFANVIPTHDK